MDKQTLFFQARTYKHIFMRTMRWLRSYRFLMTIWFIIAAFVFVYRFYSTRTISKRIVFNSLSKKIDARLLVLGHQFNHINMSMLLDKPISNKFPSITYRCREWCGGWGDRLRGITSTFILAVLMQRQFHIDMPYPCELTQFLEPHLYDWRSKNYSRSNRNQLHFETTRNSQLARILYQNISSSNFIDMWSQYDDIYLTTNSDYITPALNNPYIQNIVRFLNVTRTEASQIRLFPLLFEVLFRPTFRLSDTVDRLLSKVEQEQKQLVCLHLRIGQNPTMINDKILSHRETMVDDMLRFIEQNITTTRKDAFIFVTSDSMEINRYIHEKYGSTRVLSIPGPIIHIDRSSSSSNEQCQGFLKVLADFYVLGECDVLTMSRSGFSEWASRRRLSNQFDQLYLYCRGVHQIIGHTWRRPHVIC